MDAREALERLGRCIGAAFSRRADILFMAHDAAARERDKDNEALAVLRKVVEAQERHDEAGEGRSSAGLAGGAMRRNGEADTPDAPSPGLSIDDERALESIIIRDKHDLPDWHLTFATRDYLRSRLYAPKVRVTREWVQRFIPCDCIDAYKDRGLAQPDCRYHQSSWEEMLNAIGISVDDGQEKGREE